MGGPRAVTANETPHRTHLGSLAGARSQGGPAASWIPAAIVAGSFAAVLAIAYLIVAPPAADLAAAAYRAQLFSRAGFTVWDNGWYGGHYLLGYSLLSPMLSTLLGVRTLLALSTVLATVLFAAVACNAFGRRAGTAAAVWFALSLGGEMLSGRVPYELGLVIALGALLAFQRRHMLPALLLALCTGLASPVAAAFLALAALATVAAAPWGHGAQDQHTGTAAVRGVALAACALIPPLALAVAFPEGGYEPFASSAFWPELAGVVIVGLIVAPRWRTLRLGIGLYAVALCLAYALHTPVGGNAARLGALLAGPIVAGVLWESRPKVLALAVPVLLYWTLVTPVRDLVAIAGAPSLSPSFYAPLAAEVHKLTGGAPTRIEVPMTRAHAEAQYMPAAGGLAGTQGIALARGWERQLDTRYDRLFYRSSLAAPAYRSWLDDNGVTYVALPNAPMDAAGRAEASLIASRPPFLRELWHSPHWRLYAVTGSPGLTGGGARVTAWGADSFTLAIASAGTYEVRVRYSPYWNLRTGSGCVGQASGGWTAVKATRPGVVNVGIAFSLARVFEHGPRCR
jgi:hypothetical protein